MSKVVLILGAGSNIGAHVSRAFTSQGYKVALAARTLKESDNTPSQIHIPADFSDPTSIITAFSKTKALLGVPSVVVYNGKTQETRGSLLERKTKKKKTLTGNQTASAATSNPVHDPLSLALEDFEKDLKINTTSAFIAAQQAALAFASLPDSASKTFIYTGNILNETIIPSLMTLGAGKSAMAHVVRTAAEAYKEKGFK